jgi:signal peptidase II
VNTTTSAQPTAWSQRIGALRWTSLTLLVILVDQLTKAMIATRLRLFEVIPLLPILEFQRLHNEGAAFSFLADASGWQRWFFVALAVLASAGILAWLRQIDPRQKRLLAISLALVLGGAVGNLIDRIWHGHVIDFIHFHWERWTFLPFGSFPAFNVADTAISVGVALLLIDTLLEARRHRKAAASNPPPPS